MSTSIEQSTINAMNPRLDGHGHRESIMVKDSIRKGQEGGKFAHHAVTVFFAPVSEVLFVHTLSLYI
jgi:hypothetical protein